MTTLRASGRDLAVVTGFFALVALGIALSVGLRGSPTAGLVFAGIAVAIIVAGVVLNRRPPPELRITPEAVELAIPARSLGRIERAAAGGAIRFDRVVRQGRLHVFLAGGGGWSGERLPLDGFDGDAVRAALLERGWYVEADGAAR